MLIMPVPFSKKIVTMGTVSVYGISLSHEDSF